MSDRLGSEVRHEGMCFREVGVVTATHLQGGTLRGPPRCRQDSRSAPEGRGAPRTLARPGPARTFQHLTGHLNRTEGPGREHY